MGEGGDVVVVDPVPVGPDGGPELVDSAVVDPQDGAVGDVVLGPVVGALPRFPEPSLSGTGQGQHGCVVGPAVLDDVGGDGEPGPGEVIVHRLIGGVGEHPTDIEHHGVHPIRVEGHGPHI